MVVIGREDVAHTVVTDRTAVRTEINAQPS